MIDPTQLDAEPEPEPPAPPPPPLIVFGGEDTELLCIDDTCVPAGAIE